MAGNDLWKYCEAKEAEDVLRSFHLLEGTGVSDEKYLACLYAVSNHTEEHYHTAVIQKKNGGMRKLSVPDTAADNTAEYCKKCIMRAFRLAICNCI